MNIDKKKCVGCSNCVSVCPMGAIYIDVDKLASINEEACVECYTCYRGLSVENLPARPVRFIRRVLSRFGLRFQPEPDICPTGAVVPTELEWPRSLRRVFSDPVVPHELTGIAGRGTAEVKTNDVTGRVKEGEAGFVVELGRPGVGVYFREVDRVARTLASSGVVFEKENPVTNLMVDPIQGCIREDILDEKVLSCILESKIKLEQVPLMLEVMNELAPTLDTVISLGVSTRCDENGEDPLREVLNHHGFHPWRAKCNLGLGRAIHPVSPKPETTI
jgi:ferredoxin